jgi:hypothetical protein
MKSSVLARLPLALVAAFALAGFAGCVAESGPEAEEQVQSTGSTLARPGQATTAVGGSAAQTTISDPTATNNSSASPTQGGDINPNDPGPHPWVPRPAVVNATKGN